MKLKDIYLRIKKTAEKEMPYLQYIDLQKKQFEKATENYPIPIPALLVEFKGADFSNIGKQGQIGDSSVNIYFYKNLVTDTFNDAELESETLELLDVKDKLFQVFQGLKIASTSRLIRKSESDFVFENDYVYFWATFTFVQYEKKKECLGKIKANPGLIVEHKKT
jgi:hypothetical protein